MATFVSLQRTETEYCNFTYFLHAADKSCPMTPGSTVIVVNDDQFPRYIFAVYLADSLTATCWKILKGIGGVRG